MQHPVRNVHQYLRQERHDVGLVLHTQVVQCMCLFAVNGGVVSSLRFCKADLGNQFRKLLRNHRCNACMMFLQRQLKCLLRQLLVQLLCEGVCQSYGYCRCLCRCKGLEWCCWFLCSCLCSRHTGMQLLYYFAKLRNLFRYCRLSSTNIYQLSAGLCGFCVQVCDFLPFLGHLLFDFLRFLDVALQCSNSFA